MKKSIFIISSLVLIGSIAMAQKKETPNILSDHVIDQGYTIEGMLRLQVPVPLGFGVAGSYYIPNIIHFHGELGAGWTFVTKPSESESGLFAGWFNVFAGYPIHFQDVGNTRYVISSSQSRNARGTTISEAYYEIDAPYHYFIIPEAGFVVNPRGPYAAPNLAAGITFRRLLNAEARIEARTGKVFQDRLRKYTYFSGGLLFPLKDQIILDDGSVILPTQRTLKPYLKVGWYAIGVTWEVALSAFGYADEALFIFSGRIPIR